MSEIRRLRVEQEQQAALSRGVGVGGPVSTRNPVLMAELRGLRQHRDELERRMAGLQSSRRELMTQLESLMCLLRAVCILPCLSLSFSTYFYFFFSASVVLMNHIEKNWHTAA